MVQRADPGPGQTHENFSSWARYVPNFFLSETLSTNHHVALSRSRRNDTHTNEAALKSQMNEEPSTCTTPDLQAKSYGSEACTDIEKGNEVKAQNFEGD